MSVNTEINRITNEVATQKSLIEQITTALDGKAAGGGSGNAEIKTGELTVEISMSSPGYYDYKLTADGFTPTKYKILIIYANETNSIGTTNTPLAVAWGDLARDYDRAITGSATLTTPYEMYILSDYVMLNEMTERSSSYTRNSINYYAI